jgi:hypothetical protein
MITTQPTRTVNDPCDDYVEMELGWRLPRALMGGTRQMRREARTYLPQEPLETDGAYTSRLGRSVLFNAFRKTVQNLTGRVFSKPVTLQDDVPAPIAAMAEDIDLNGRHLNLFARDVFIDGLALGLSHILVEMPPKLPEGSTLADERKAGRRPYWCHIKAENLIGWKSEMVGGRQRLTQVRIRENYFREDGLYHTASVARVRVLEPGRFEVWESGEKGWYLVEEGETSLSEIPLSTFYAERTGFMMARPPLEDQAEINVQHWQSSSDQRHILHVARVPLLFGSGFPDDFKVEQAGPNSMTLGPVGSDMKYVEHSGHAIESGRQDLESLEEQMQVLGMEVLMPKTGNQTATAKAIDSTEANSQLATMAVCLGDAIEQALMFTAQFMAGDDGGSVQVNTDFGVTMRNAEDVKALIEARKTKEISRETFWKELKRRGLLMDDFDPEVEAALIENEMPEPIEPPLEV